MRTKLDQMLDTMNMELIRMGAMCQEAISCAVHGMLCGQEELTEKTFSIERAIDEKEREIESLCMKLLLRQQPVASDLRQISAAMKMITDMERIGDQAEDIVDLIPKMSGTAEEEPLQKMAIAAQKMVTEAVDAYVKQDLALAKKVMGDDDIVDAYFNQVKSDIIAMIAANPEDGEYALDLLMIAKYFERIGDHCTNIAEWVEFSITGVHKSCQ